MKKIKSIIKIIILFVAMFCLAVNPAWATNTHTTVLDLASSQYWSITDANQTGLGVTGDLTFELWVKLAQLPSTAGSIFGMIQKDAGATNRAYVFNILTTDKLRLIYFSANTTFTVIDTDAAAFVSGDVGEWVHIAVAVDVSAKTASFYKNGSPINGTTGTADATSIQNVASAFHVGGFTQFFDGSIDDVRVWNDIRTSTEISDNYNCSLAGTETNLQGYWRFDNNGEDSTSNNNDLTNNNTATFQSTSLPFTATCGETPAEDKALLFQPIIFN